MTIRERPRLDRERLCREREARLRARAYIEEALELLEPGESLGAPHRTEDRVILPIEQAEEAAAADAPSLRALVASWMEEEEV